MRALETALPGVVLVERPSWDDERGFLVESFSAAKYAEAGIRGPFVIDLHTRSRQGTLRGLHFQQPHPQAKLVQVARGTIFDVAVDVRLGSPHFGRWVAVELSDQNLRQLWIPTGFAHGFCVLSEEADVLYKLDSEFVPTSSRYLAWNDPALGIPWPVSNPRLSPKDRDARPLCDQRELPSWVG
jgi:dTDP-4-dehydrorhamnose 3,5-epimerase